MTSKEAIDLRHSLEHTFSLKHTEMLKYAAEFLQASVSSLTQIPTEQGLVFLDYVKEQERTHIDKTQGHQLHKILGSHTKDHYGYVGAMVERNINSFTNITRGEYRKVVQRITLEREAKSVYD